MVSLSNNNFTFLIVDVSWIPIDIYIKNTLKKYDMLWMIVLKGFTENKIVVEIILDWPQNKNIQKRNGLMNNNSFFVF